MAIISNTAPYSTPSANLNLDSLSVVKVQPASVFNTTMSVAGISNIFSGNNSIALAPSKVNVVPAITPSTVGAVYTSKAPSSLTAAAPSKSDFLGTLGNIATGFLNLGANVLLDKYSSKPQEATAESSSARTAEGKTASPQTNIFQDGQPLDTGFNSLLGALGSAFFSQNKQQTAQGTITTAQPTLLSYALIAGVVVLIVVLLRRK